MCARYCIEAVEPTLRAIMSDDRLPFGGKCVLFRGDFRQILHLVPKASRGLIVHMCWKSSVIFIELHVQRLTGNMRIKALKEDLNAETAATEYPEYLLGVGEGRLKLDGDSNINLPPSINVFQSYSELIDAIFGDISAKYSDTEWLTSKAILATMNSRLKSLNDEIIYRFLGRPSMFHSADSVVSQNSEDQYVMELKYPQELLNSINAGSSSTDHVLKLKRFLCYALAQ